MVVSVRWEGLVCIAVSSLRLKCVSFIFCGLEGNMLSSSMIAVPTDCLVIVDGNSWHIIIMLAY